MRPQKKIAVVGGGSWGTALAQSQARLGHQVFLWLRSQDACEQINETRYNSKYYPEIQLDSKIFATTDIQACYEQAQIILLALPSSEIVPWIEETKIYLRDHQALVCTSKGLDLLHLQTLSQKLAQIYGSKWTHRHYAVLSGPSFAVELIQQLPTAVDLASSNTELRNMLIDSCSDTHFKWFPSKDMIGLEVGGALKNILAIAVGASDGYGFGENARAALITKGLKEISKVGVALGAEPETFFGLSGMGDLLLTCTGDQSRNRQVGLGLSTGKSLKDILTQIQQTAEGIRSCKIAADISERHQLETPILTETYHALYGIKDPKKAIIDLLHTIV
ncbi:MAG: NAD(P)-dependent glycerol-3-phosphate dehydrogenase [Bdellovibrionales bacterium]|nr:NAD(P)-dependent glycerol-3-phosphate dehydrogenase [Bdellovibrionales bacterium]